MTRIVLKPSPALMEKVRVAFETYGYDALTMVELADACAFTRRSLYNYFINKEDAFRAVLRFQNEQAMTAGLAAGERVRREGGSAVAIFGEILNIRYGDTRRRVNPTPHVIELHAETLRRCHDILIDVAIRFQADLEALVLDLQRARLLRLDPGVSAFEVAQFLADGARGVNQNLPPGPPEELSDRYRGISEAILKGCASLSEAGSRSVARLAQAR